MENFTFNFDDDINNVAMPVQNDVPAIYTDKSRLSIQEKFNVVMALKTKSFDDFAMIVDIYAIFGELSLAKEVHKASQDIHKYWNNVKAYKERYSTEQLQNWFDGSDARTPDMVYKAVQRSLWDQGSGVVSFGVDPCSFDVSDFSDDIKELCEDRDEFIHSSNFITDQSLPNSNKAILKAAPSRKRGLLKTDLDEKEEVDLILDSFESGDLPYAMSSEKYRSPSEPGLGMPHTLAAKEWLGGTASRFLVQEFGNVVPLFRDEDPSQIRRYSASDTDYLLISDDKQSAYHLELNPAIYAHDKFDRSGRWIWRSDQEKIKAQVNAQIISEDLIGQQQSRRAAIRRELEFRRALELRGRKTVVYDNGSPVIPIPKRLAVGSFEGKSFFIRIYKRGYSKEKEVLTNSDYLHIVGMTTVPTIDISDYFPVVLYDFSSVVLIPRKLWSKSRFSTQSNNPNYFTKAGFGYFKTGINSLAFLYALVQRSCLRLMTTSWAEGLPFNPGEHLTVLRTVLINAKGYLASLLGNGRKKQRMLNYLSASLGTLVGMYIAPATSRQGRKRLQEANDETQFVIEQENFEFHNYADVDFIPEDLYFSIDDSSSSEADYSVDQQENQSSDDDHGISHNDAYDQMDDV